LEQKAQVPDGLNLSWGNLPPWQGGLIQWQGDHDDYACSLGRVAISGGDGTDYSTQVPSDRSAWVSVATSYHAGI
jgi:hypothetical protein